MLKYFALFFLTYSFLVFNSKNLESIELNIICTTSPKNNSSKEFKDLIVSLNSNSKEIKLGGLKFTADIFTVTDSNIKWSASEVPNMYDDSNGSTHATLGRFSGDLSITFKKNNIGFESKLDLICKNLKIRERKF